MASKSVTGHIDEEEYEEVEQLIEDGKYDSFSEFVRFATRYTLSEKH